MRDDMDKVIVERPRKGGGRDKGTRQWRNSRERGNHLGMRRGHNDRKGLNENLAPLRRWLHQQVQRPWDAVYAELCRGIDRRNAVQAHIHQHVDDFVDREAVWVDGEVLVRAWPRSDHRVPLQQASRVTLFVHPLTGILLPNRRQPEARKAWRARRHAEAPVRRVAIDDWTQWHHIDSQWWELALELLPPMTAAAPRCWDALHQCWLARGTAPPPGTATSTHLFGRPHLYVAARRPVGRAEMRRRFPNGMPV